MRETRMLENAPLRAGDKLKLKIGKAWEPCTYHSEEPGVANFVIVKIPEGGTLSLHVHRITRDRGYEVVAD